MAFTERFSWFLRGVILGIVVIVVYYLASIFVIFPGFRGEPTLAIIIALIELVAWFGLMLAVGGVLGWRIIRKDHVNYLLVGFGTVIITQQLVDYVQFAVSWLR
ncbi:MAG TPA: hypothetical protein VGS11_07275 [Candidatus Bathyarchaeia archaeon]|nr:hypothetical protein [Candidatus Bathyarchaeia archaeon]